MLVVHAFKPLSARKEQLNINLFAAEFYFDMLDVCEMQLEASQVVVSLAYRVRLGAK